MQERTASFDAFCEQNLNEEQREIVNRLNGVMVVHAGAGSGKTRVITARITALLLKHAIPAQNIIALTFTNKAAREMRERVKHFLGPDIPMPYIGTFHSYCLYLLRLNRDLLEIPDFTIIDDDDQDKLIKILINRYALNKKITASSVRSLVSRLKNNSISGVVDYNSIPDMLIRDLVVLYEKEKRISRCFDFDDLLLETLKLFNSKPGFRLTHQERIRHILVDEFQDTNQVQHALLQSMVLDVSPTSRKYILDSLCAVGDEDQSIYSWRGAVAGAMLSFKNDFTHVQSHALEQNYRSVQSILTVANHIIQYNTQRKPKKLWSERQGHDRIRMITCASGYQEAEMIAGLFKMHNQMGGVLKDCAILYRSHYQSRVLEEALIRHSIPYVIVGGTQFYDRLEIKDVLAYLKLVVNPFDRMSCSRAINTPNRGLGDKFQEQFFELWEINPFLNFLEISALMMQDSHLTPSKRESLKDFMGLFLGLSRDEKPAQALEYVIAKTKYNNYLTESYEQAEAQERLANIKELLSAVRARQEDGIVTMQGFLEEVALLQEARSAVDHERDCVSLMTMHGAKGLEFHTVALPGLEEGILPSGHAAVNPESVEEERRLLYVGITRARERLLLSHARYRYTYGRMSEQKASRFVKELDMSKLITCGDIAQFNAIQMSSYAKQWLTSSTPLRQLNKRESSVDTTPERESKVNAHNSNAIKRTEAKFEPAQSVSSKQKIAQKTKIPWVVNQRVKHIRFGTGVIEAVEVRTIDHANLTIRFEDGSKKISSKFVTILDN